MSASSMISDILPARPARDAQKLRAEARDGAFSQALSGAMATSEAKAAPERAAPVPAAPARREDVRAEPQRPRPADRAEDARETSEQTRTDSAAPEQPAAPRETSKPETTSPEPREAGAERDGAKEPETPPPVSGETATVPITLATATAAAEAPVLDPAVAVLATPESGDPGAAATITAVVDPQIDLSQVIGGQTAPAPAATVAVTNGQVAAAQANAGQANAGQATTDPAQVAGQIASGVIGALGTVQSGSNGSGAPDAKTGGATAAAAAENATPAKADDAAKVAVRTEATQGFAAQLAAQSAAGSTEGAKASPDGVQALASAQSGAAASGTSSAPVTTPQQGLARSDAPVPLQALAVEIGMRAMRGAKEFAIRLDPEDMGRVDIRLEISEKGEVQAKVMVERVETLQLLQRDARTLERAFDQAGLKTNPDGLQFSLRDPGQQGQQQGRDPAGQSRDNRGAGADLAADEALPPLSAIYRAPGLGALDIRI